MAKKIKFLGGTSGVLRTEFQERLKYKNFVDFPGMIDTLYKDFSYGLINKNFEPVYLVNDDAVLSNFPNLADNIRCLSFVAAAFQNFRDDYLNIIDNTNRNFPPFLEGVIPVKGHISFEQSYSDYITYNSVKYSAFLQNDRRVDDYSCFVSTIKEILAENLKSFPITRSGFLLSRHNDTRSSGLVLELAKLDYNRDLEKGEIIQSQDFRCFLDYANSAGFYVDKFNPWRLYANLEHPTMKLLMRRGRSSLEYENPEEVEINSEYVMNSIYRLRSQDDDLYDLQDFIVKTYNEIKKVVPFYTRTVYNGNSTRKTTENVFRPEIEMLSSEEWLEMVLMVRLMELGSYDKDKFASQLEPVIHNYRSYGVRQAIGAIGQIGSRKIKELYEKRRENNTTPGY